MRTGSVFDPPSCFSRCSIRSVNIVSRLTPRTYTATMISTFSADWDQHGNRQQGESRVVEM